MTSVHSQLLAWIEDGSIQADCIQPALRVSGITPGARRWRQFLDKLMLGLGSLCLGCSVVFFVAYNWNALGHYAQFALVQVLMVISVLFYWRLGPDRLVAKAALTVSAILLGALLALFGQTYQTGADPWQLYAGWAALMLPWVLVGRFAPLWLMWLGILNLAAVFYYDANFGLLGAAFFSKDDLLWLLLALNILAMISWELVIKRLRWLANGWSGRWPVRLLAMASSLAMTILVLRAIFDPASLYAITWVIYLLWLLATYTVYRRRLPDLFMLANACVSMIVCITSLFADIMLQGRQYALSFLLLALIVVAQAAFAAVWLRRVHQEHLS